MGSIFFTNRGDSPENRKPSTDVHDPTAGTKFNAPHAGVRTSIMDRKLGADLAASVTRQKSPRKRH